MLTTLLSSRLLARLLASPAVRYAAGALVLWLALLAFQSWSERQGARKCEARVAVAVAQEKERQKNEINRVLFDAATLQEQVTRVQQDRDRLAKEIIDAVKAAPPGPVCIPRSDVRRLRQLQR